MKIRFIQQHIVRGQARAEDLTYEEGQIADFGKDPVANSYATAYVDRGYAVEYDEVAVRTAQRATKDEADAKAKDEEAAKATAEADAKAKGQQGGGQVGQK